MIKINVKDLLVHSNLGNDLFDDKESFLIEISDNDIEVYGGLREIECVCTGIGTASQTCARKSYVILE
jgi:hypothetical protein